MFVTFICSILCSVLLVWTVLRLVGTSLGKELVVKLKNLVYLE